MDGTGDAENIGQETVTALLIRTLYRHAAVCIGLELRDKALADYDRLEQLGEDVSSDRDAMNDIPADTGADAESPSDLEEPDAGEATASRETTAAEEAKANSGKEEPAASSTSVSSSTSSSSKAEEKPASSVSQAPAVEPETSYSTTNSGMDGYTDGTLSYTEKTTVTYQVGGKKLSVKYDYNSKFVFSDGTPDDGPVGVERVGYTRSNYQIRRDTYTLSEPTQSVEHVGNDHVIIYVPAGTTISVSESNETNFDDAYEHDLWLCTLDGISTDEQRKAECKKDTSPENDSRLTNHGTSVTLQKNQMCKVFYYDFWAPQRNYGGVTFCAV